jgi:primosomal protein N' (replication factor Y)
VIGMADKGRYAQVIVDIAVSDTDRVFTYRVPEGMRLDPGSRVEVPFGHRQLEGYVLALTDETDLDEERIKPVTAALEDYPALLPDLMALAREISAQRHCPLALALRLMLPAEMRGGRVKVKTELAARLLIKPEQVAEAVKAETRSPKRRLLLQLLSDGLTRPVSELRALVRDPLPALRALEEKGLVEVADQEVLRQPFADVGLKEPEPTLTPGQEEALGEIIPAIRRGSGAFLLHGITGSGKTEVYIRAVKQCLREGKGAIVLIPEIVLTPQMVSWFRGRFGDVAAVMHSRLSAGERFDEWRRARRGKARVVIGARSAVFAPVERLGLIVVDEEHEPTYQAENAPSYDAREIALSRAGREGAVVLLASATPSILSFAKAMRGDYMLLEMPERVGESRLPQVIVVDMREELRLGNRSMFSGLLQQRLEHCIASGQQAMIFLNRRGYAPGVLCRKCGYVVPCPQCDVKMTYHQHERVMRCHYCGFKRPLPETCPACGSRFIKPFGIGTQKVEEELRKLFPEVEIVRLDLDTTAGKDGHQKLLDQFRSGKARIMVGTQMIAKGLDFPQVTLVGAVLADLTLNLPDYRSEERTFQLLTQVAGRAGRAGKPGEVIIQTYKPEHFAVVAAAAQDYRGFFNQEFARRRQRLYPPFTMLARLLVEARQEKQAREVSGVLYARLVQKLEESPSLKRRVIFAREDDSPIKRIAGLSRAQVFMKLLVHPDSDELLQFLKDLSEEPWPCRVNLEVNPASMA